MRPLPPMGRQQVYALLRFRIEPTAENASAREHQSVNLAALNNGKFKVAVKRRGKDELPLHRLA